MSLNQAFVWNLGTCCPGVLAKQARSNACSKPIREKSQAAETARTRVPIQDRGAEQPVVVKKSAKADGTKGLRYPALSKCQLNKEEELMNKAKQFAISQETVQEAFKRVKASKGAAGVDGESIEEFEKDLERNLYKIWNRMSSGSYMPPAVKSVEIPKDKGGARILGVPTVADRVAQMVVKIHLEPEVEPIFHTDSYGYRPNKSALDAVGKARERCFKTAWVIDLDIKAFFDMLSHELVLKMVKKHTESQWILLYVERWLKAPLQIEDGTLVERIAGSPQGSVISPLLSNIVMHHVFDEWMVKVYPRIEYERYADDILLHCVSQTQADFILKTVKERFAEHQLEVNEEKTRLVYCKNANRPGEYAVCEFDYLGYTFKERTAINHRGELFRTFSPAISDQAKQKLGREVRDWRLHMRSGHKLERIAQEINPKVQGWLNYYGRYGSSQVMSLCDRIEQYLVKWAMRKFKTMHRNRAKAREWLSRVKREQPRLFAHWRYCAKSS